MCNSMDFPINSPAFHQLGLHWLRINQAKLVKQWMRFLSLRSYEFNCTQGLSLTSQWTNYLAIELLEALMITEPSEEQIQRTEKWINRSITHDSFLSIH